ncbi:MAG: chaperone modulator CbpM [Thermoanaerobaculia bacterium]|jgi:chaperone modulatory protein CbpM
MPNEIVPVLRGTVLDEEGSFTLEQICQICRLEKKVILTLVEEGVLDPEGDEPATWRFPGTSVTHVRIVVRLQRDLGVNLEGAAIVLDLLDRLALSGRGR